MSVHGYKMAISPLKEEIVGEYYEYGPNKGIMRQKIVLKVSNYMYDST